MGFIDTIVRWLAPDAGVGVFNDWRWVLNSSLSTGWLALAALAVLLAVAGGAWGQARLPIRSRLLLVSLRLVAGLWVLLLFMRPAIELRAVSRVRTRVVLLVDDSRSMELPTRDGSRAERVSEHIKDSARQLSALSSTALIEPVLFSEHSRPVESIPEPLVCEGKSTKLGRALSEVSWQSSGRDLAAVVLYSDGADTSGLTPDTAAREAEKLGVPIYAVGFSDPRYTADLAIRRVLVDDFAFVHNPVTIDVEVEQQGLGLSEVEVTLRRDLEPMMTKTARFVDGVARVSFEFKPGRIGKRAYQISVPVQAGEVVKSNNETGVVLKVIRDRLRVLQVAGRPSWDVRFLREHLEQNPNIDLISFFILRSPTDLEKAPQHEMALIPFPVNELFTPPEIDSFDVVIYQDFSYRPYRMAHYLRFIRDYVEKGGALLMVGGDQGFDAGGYADTELAEVLPIRLGAHPAWDPGEFSPRLTEAGRQHPITHIGEPGEPTEAPYQRLPPLAGFNPSRGLMPGAQALLSHSGLPGNPPLVAIRSVGEGRSMAVATSSLWYWRFRAAESGSAGRAYDRFWTTALRWLVRDPELSRVRVEPKRSVVPSGERIEAELRVLGPDYRGLKGAKLHAELHRLGEEADAEPKLRTLRTGKRGEAVVEFERPHAGSYQLRVWAEHAGHRIGETTEPFIVEAASRELMSPFPRPEILRALAEASGGAFVDIEEPLPKIEVKDPRRVEVDRSRRVPVWNTWPPFFVLLGLLASEWWLRRRAGLV